MASQCRLLALPLLLMLVAPRCLVESSTQVRGRRHTVPILHLLLPPAARRKGISIGTRLRGTSPGLRGVDQAGKCFAAIDERWERKVEEYAVTGRVCMIEESVSEQVCYIEQSESVLVRSYKIVCYLDTQSMDPCLARLQDRSSAAGLIVAMKTCQATAANTLK
eukprot:51751-Hanusia_phi.AAC.1